MSKSVGFDLHPQSPYNCIHKQTEGPQSQVKVHKCIQWGTKSCTHHWQWCIQLLRREDAPSSLNSLSIDTFTQWTLNIENWQWCIQLREERMHPVYSAHCPLTLSHIGHEYWLFNTGHWILVVMYTADMHPMHPSHLIDLFTDSRLKCTQLGCKDAHICSASPHHPL